MKQSTQFKTLFLTLCMSVLLFALAACGKTGSSGVQQSGAPTQDSGTESSVKAVAVKVNPHKTEYFVGDAYDFTGGILTVTHLDGTTEEVSMLDEGVTFSATEATAVGNKSVTVFYGEKKASVRFAVSEQGVTATFNLNYEGAPPDETIAISKNTKLEQPSVPTRDGYTFYRWYTDAKCTAEFDFTAAVDHDVTLYAQWQEEGATYHTATLDLNYYGGKPASFVQLVKDGESTRTPDTVPERTDYSFGGWYTDAACTSLYDSTQGLTGDITLYAKWNKTKSGESTYTFEAELTDLTGKSGPGFSGTSAETNMIVFQEGVGAGGNRYISYLYQQGNSVEFYIASDEDVSNVTLVASLSAEMADLTIDPGNYTISVNASPLSYSSISFTNVPSSTNDGKCLPFADYTLSVNVSLKKGANVIKFITSNSDNYVGSGTISGTAPLIDCVRLTTNAVLTWDANFNLPMASNFKG